MAGLASWLRLLLVALAPAGVAAPAQARELLILAGDSIPPYAIPERNSGAEVELMRAALGSQGLQVRFRYVPLRRLSTDLDLLDADGSTRGVGPDGVGHLSAPYIRYQACVLRRPQDPPLEGLAALARLRIQAFQGAREELGPAFAQAVQHNPRYAEINNQHNQLNLLRLGRTDVVVADRHIAAWHWQALEGGAALRCDLAFAPSFYSAHFRRAEDARAFDAGLQQLRRSGEYARILARWGLPGAP